MIVRLKESASDAPVVSTSTTSAFDHEPVLVASSSSATLALLAVLSRMLIFPLTAPSFGTRTTMASAPPFRKNCCTANPSSDS